MTADGKTSTRAFTPSAFTSHADKVQQVRAGADAVLAGRCMVATDSMSMGIPAVPLRVVVSNSGNLDLAWKVFSYSGAPLIIFSTRRMPARLRAAVARKAELFLFSGRIVDLRKSLEILRSEFGVKRLVCEGGGSLLRSLASLDLVDSICLTIAPLVFGGRLAPTLTGFPCGFITPPREFEIARKSVLGGECFLEFRRKKRDTDKLKRG